MPHKIDFRAVKQSVSWEQLLSHYQLSLKRVNGNTLRGRCPLPTHSNEKDSNTFSITLRTDKAVNGAFACHSDSCKAARDGRIGGDILTFVSLVEKCSLFDAAVKLTDWFGTSNGEKKSPAANGQGNSEQPPTRPSPTPDGPPVNHPLGFTLKDIQPDHPWLKERGISSDLAAFFGIGFFPGKGSMAGRVVIPICNEKGELVAYAGRSIDGSEPKYKLPPNFHKGLVLWNLHRISGDTVIVVEGFFDVLKLHPLPAVALMGTSMSEEQEKLLAGKKVVLMLDDDEPGRKATEEIAHRLGCVVGFIR